MGYRWQDDELYQGCEDTSLAHGSRADVEPPPQPAPAGHTGRFEPAAEDWAAYRELSERGSFRPFDQIRPKQLPSHARDRWGRAIAAHQAVQRRRPR